MKKLKLQKILSIVLAAVSIFALNLVKANAAWMRNANGWWNTEGDSCSVGWRLIDNEWYYFDMNGYLKTGWILDGGKWYYLNTDGAMAKNTSIDGYKIGSDGSWIEDEQQKNQANINMKKNNLNSKNSSVYSEKDADMVKSYIESQKYKIIKNMGVVNSYLLTKDLLYGLTDSIVNKQIWSVQKNKQDKYLNKTIKVYEFTVENHPLEKIYNVNTNVFIMICNGEIIGGYSIPNSDIDGSVYSLDGKTAEEITGLDAKQ